MPCADRNRGVEWKGAGDAEMEDAALYRGPARIGIAAGQDHHAGARLDQRADGRRGAGIADRAGKGGRGVVAADSQGGGGRTAHVAQYDGGRAAPPEARELTEGLALVKYAVAEPSGGLNVNGPVPKAKLVWATMAPPLTTVPLV